MNTSTSSPSAAPHALARRRFLWWGACTAGLALTALLEARPLPPPARSTGPLGHPVHLAEDEAEDAFFAMADPGWSA